MCVTKDNNEISSLKSQLAMSQRQAKRLAEVFSVDYAGNGCVECPLLDNPHCPNVAEPNCSSEKCTAAILEWAKTA